MAYDVMTNNRRKLVMLNGNYESSGATFTDAELEAIPNTASKGSVTAGFVGMGADLFSNIFTKVSDNRTAETLEQMKMDDKRLTNELTVALRMADASANASERDGYLAQIKALQVEQNNNERNAIALQRTAPKEANIPVILGTGAVGVGVLYLLLRKK